MKTEEQVHFAARILLASAAAVTLCLFAAVVVLAAVPVLVAASLSHLAISLRAPRIVLLPPKLAAAR